MFHFPSFPPHALCVQAWVTGHDSSRVSPFGNPRITARLTAPRGLSQPPTSFFGSWYLGIHRAPLLTWPQRCSRPLCSSQGTGGSPTPDHRVRVSRPKPANVPFDGGWSLSSVASPPNGGGEQRTRGEQASEEAGPFPQDPTACLSADDPFRVPLSSRAVVLARRSVLRLMVNVPPLSLTPGAYALGMSLDRHPEGIPAKCSLERR